MLLLTQGNTDDLVVVTLEESRTITNPYYHFVFTHVTTNVQVIITKQYSEDQSLYTRRFNQFTIDTDTAFTGKPTGQWNYDVYESESATYTAGLNLLETGKMKLQPAEALTITGTNTTTTYAGYGG